VGQSRSSFQAGQDGEPIGKDARTGGTVALLEGIFGSHVNHLTRSLKQAGLRQDLLSENLANVNTPGYKRKDIDFGIELDSAKTKLGNKKHENMIRKDEGSLRRDGNSVDLESEVANMAETEFRYRLLTDMTNRYFTGLKSVIREGK